MSKHGVRRHWAGILAGVFVLVGVVGVLLAVDARTWQRTIARDDVRFRALPSHEGLWEPPSILPGSPASRLIGASDTVTYRRAVQYFWLSRIGTNPEAQQDLPALRAATQSKLQQLMLVGPTQQQRSLAANLLGILIVTAPISSSDSEAFTTTLKHAAGYFQRAIAIDPADFDAKQNLELVLRLKRPGGGRFGKDARAGYGFGRGRGATLIGGGY